MIRINCDVCYSEIENDNRVGVEVTFTPVDNNVQVVTIDVCDDCLKNKKLLHVGIPSPYYKKPEEVTTN